MQGVCWDFVRDCRSMSLSEERVVWLSAVLTIPRPNPTLRTFNPWFVFPWSIHNFSTVFCTDSETTSFDVIHHSKGCTYWSPVPIPSWHLPLGHHRGQAGKYPGHGHLECSVTSTTKKRLWMQLRSCPRPEVQMTTGWDSTMSGTKVRSKAILGKLWALVQVKPRILSTWSDACVAD
jgi:hypothetical protein